MSQATEGRENGDLRFGLLGRLQAARGGRELALGGRQQRAILARLLVDAGAVVSVESIADAVWGEHPTASAASTIHSYVSRLRDIVEPARGSGSEGEVVVTGSGGYRLLLEHASTDSAEFEAGVATGRAMLQDGEPAAAAEALGTALDLWRGAALADLTDFEFARAAAAPLDELRLVALEYRIDADLALGRHRVLTAELDSLVEEHPLRERLHAQRMLAHYRNGCQSDALAGYRQLRDTLADELGVDPGPELQRLHQAILRQSPELDWPGASRAAREGQPPPEPPPRDSPPRRARVRLLAAATVGAAALAAIIAGLVLTGSPPRAGSTPTTLKAFPANSVGSVDAGGALRAAVEVGQGPYGVAYGAGRLWVANSGSGTVSVVDPRTGHVVQTVAVGDSPTAITVAGDDVWVVNGGDGTVSRVNADSMTEADVVTVGNQPTAIAAGPTGIWVANGGDNTVQRIDPTSRTADEAIPVGAYPDGLAVAGDTLWVANGRDGTISPVRWRSRTVEGPVSVGAGPKGVAVTKDDVWVTNQLDQTMSRIDRSDAHVVQTLTVGDGPGAVVAGRNALWVANEFDGTLSRVDPESGSLADPIPTGSSPRGLAMVDSTPWVAAGSLGDTHRGGTLEVEYRDWVPGGLSADFQHGYDLTTLGMLYDGLVAQRRTGGVDGLSLAPDLATSLPRPAAGGRVYSFTLRRGVRYSTGEEVRPSDIRRGLVRALKGPGRPYFTGIVGARACPVLSRDCDLSRGVVTDDAAYRVVIRLTEPDPEFLYKLSVFAYAVPAGAPLGPNRVPLPATGPYMVSGFTEGDDELTLVRNPYFDQWSFAARPDGYPDRIHWTHVGDPDRAVSDAVRGRTDVVDLLGTKPSRGTIATLARENPSLLHSDFGQTQTYWWMNTRAAPFDDVRARRAVNYALDRRRLVALNGGANAVAATCQLFPPGFPAYDAYCPYAKHPDALARNQDPDLARARRLVAASGAAGALVRLNSGLPLDAPTSYLVHVLRSLGLDVEVGTFVDADIGFGYWGVDFAAPSNFWAPVLSCASVRPRGLFSPNFAGFCDRSVDDLAREALDLEATDPAASRARWTRVDRSLTRDAPWAFALAVQKTAVVSPRVGNYQSNPVVGPLLDQMWVR